MSEHEKRLREWVETYTAQGYMASSVREHLLELIAPALSSARDAALAEGSVEMERIGEARAAIRLRALQSAPASVVQLEKVREVLGAVRAEVDPNGDPDDAPSAWEEGRVDGIETAARRLGVDLDATGGPMDTRQTCTCLGACRGPEGLGPGWKCALGKTAPSARALDDGHRRDGEGCLTDCPGCASDV